MKNSHCYLQTFTNYYNRTQEKYNNTISCLLILCLRIFFFLRLSRIWVHTQLLLIKAFLQFRNFSVVFPQEITVRKWYQWTGTPVLFPYSCTDLTLVMISPPTGHMTNIYSFISNSISLVAGLFYKTCQVFRPMYTCISRQVMVKSPPSYPVKVRF